MTSDAYRFKRSPEMIIRLPSWPELKEKLKPATSRPGWVFTTFGLLLELYHFVRWALDFKGFVEEAISTASQVPIAVRAILTFVISPWFGIFLVVLGLSYVVFVPVEEQLSPHATTAKYVAWVGCGVVFLLLWTTVTAGLFLRGATFRTHLMGPSGGYVDCVESLDFDNMKQVVCTFDHYYNPTEIAQTWELPRSSTTIPPIFLTNTIPPCGMTFDKAKRKTVLLLPWNMRAAYIGMIQTGVFQ